MNLIIKLLVETDNGKENVGLCLDSLRFCICINDYNGKSVAAGPNYFLKLKPSSSLNNFQDKRNQIYIIDKIYITIYRKNTLPI